MFQRRITDWIRHAPNPGLRGFALLSALESASRAILISVLPLAMYQAFRDAQLISAIYLGIGLCSLTAGLMAPWMMRFVPRRWMYTIGALLYLVGAAAAIWGEPKTVAFVVLANSLAAVLTLTCFNAYVLDYVERVKLGRVETLRIFYGAVAWTAGPFVGVSMYLYWQALPFILSAMTASALLVAFWIMRLGNGKLITRARKPAPNPLAYLGRFFRQPRLVSGWILAVVRAGAWWTYAVYLPIFTVENGLGERIAGLALSMSYSLLFAVPLVLRLLERTSVKTVIRMGFLLSGLGFFLAGFTASMPLLTLAMLFAATVFVVLLDVSGGLPFLLAVKPSERTEMSAVYSTYRDFSSIVSPGLAWLVLLALPVPFVFTAVGVSMLGCWHMAGRLHPRLGASRLKPPAPLAPTLQEVTEQRVGPPGGV